jgi:hypothetical protein
MLPTPKQIGIELHISADDCRQAGAFSIQGYDETDAQYIKRLTDMLADQEAIRAAVE